MRVVLLLLLLKCGVLSQTVDLDDAFVSLLDGLGLYSQSSQCVVGTPLWW